MDGLRKATEILEIRVLVLLDGALSRTDGDFVPMDLLESPPFRSEASGYHGLVKSPGLHLLWCNELGVTTGESPHALRQAQGGREKKNESMAG